MRTAMAMIQTPAAKVTQGNLTLFATAIKVRDLIRDGFYSVEKLDPSSGTGFQRVLNNARARKLCDYIVKGQDLQDAFLPTSVFLATHKSIPFDSKTNTITIDTNEVGSFNVVDGQHRLEGLKMAATKDARVYDFVMPVNIAVELEEIAQMCHFLIVNTTQKSVDKAVELNIIARLTQMTHIEKTPYLPKWIQNMVDSGEVNKAQGMVNFLNDCPDSPWHGRINMANEHGGGRVNSASFVTSIRKYVLTADNPILHYQDKYREIFLNYWKAVTELIDDEGNATVLYKYNGVVLFCMFSVPFFTKLVSMYSNNFTVDIMKELLSKCFECMEGEHAGVVHTDWWRTGGTASGMNQAAIRPVFVEMARALNRPTSSGEIEI